MQAAYKALVMLFIATTLLLLLSWTTIIGLLTWYVCILLKLFCGFIAYFAQMQVDLSHPSDVAMCFEHASQ